MRGDDVSRDSRESPGLGRVLHGTMTSERRDRPSAGRFFLAFFLMGDRDVSRPEPIVRLISPPKSRRRPLRFAVAVGVAGAFAAGAFSAQAADPPAPAAPAPLGVFGVDMPGAGKFVFSFLPSFTRMQGSKIGATSVSPQYIVSNVTTPYTPVGQHLLRMAPKKLDIDGQGFSLAYGLTRNVTLTASTVLLEKSVDMEAFKGLSGLTPLGFKVGSTSGLGDTTMAAIVRVHQDPLNQVKLNMGLSLPTGSTTDNMSLLLPSNTAPSKRGFYAMQPGSGTIDALPGIAYSGGLHAWSWGLAYRARLPLDSNAQGWRYGDLHEINAWGGYAWAPGLETTLRLYGATQGAIRGDDPLIRGYAQGSTPQFYGGQQISVFGGVMVGGRYFGLAAAQVGLEAGVPLYQRLNGPQLGRDWQLNLALRYKL